LAECVEYTVKRASALSGLPVIVTENGIGTADDTQRIRYLGAPSKDCIIFSTKGTTSEGIFSGPCWTILNGYSVIVRNLAWLR